MKKILVIFILFIICGTLIYAQTLQYEATVRSKFANIYAEPDLQSERLRTLTKNVKVIVVSVSAEWANIQVYGNGGWIEVKHLNISGTEKSNKSVSEGKAVPESKEVIVTDSSGVRRVSYKKDIAAYEVGMLVGLGKAFLSGKDIGTYNGSSLSLVSTCFVLRNFNPNLGIQTGIGLISLGGSGKYYGLPAELRMNYYSYDLLARGKINIGNYKSRVIYALAGGEILFLQNSFVKTDNNRHRIGNMRKINYGLKFALGLRLMKIGMIFNKVDLISELSAGFGLMPLSEGLVSLDMKYRYFNFSVGLIFSFD